MDIFEKIQRSAVVPVVVLHDAARAVPTAQALLSGGISVMEITFRTDAAAEAIAAVAAQCPDMTVGAGTVVTVQQCRAAMAAGAQFIVCPGYEQSIVDLCLASHIPVVPGCAGPSDMMRAVQSGLRVVKFFPAQQLGGLAFLKAVAPVFPSLRFMPTGGVKLENLGEYLAAPTVLACGGSYMVSAKLIEDENWTEITALCRQTAALAEKVRGDRV